MTEEDKNKPWHERYEKHILYTKYMIYFILICIFIYGCYRLYKKYKPYKIENLVQQETLNNIPSIISAPVLTDVYSPENANVIPDMKLKLNIII